MNIRASIRRGDWKCGTFAAAEKIQRMNFSAVGFYLPRLMSSTFRSVALSLALAASARAAVDFNRDVRPILNKHCTGCHGGVKQAGGISFVYREKALAEGKSGAVTIVPGKAEESEMILRVTSKDNDERMPPPEHGEGKPLSEAEVATLRQWIGEGAKWGEHWSFVKPLPQSVPPVKDAAWGRSELDRFVLAEIEGENLKPSREADRAQWLRRATFDLTGLPPTPEELATSTSEKATPEQVVDRLLASPHFGERWAAMWMDLARYADTQGYEKDNGREVWPWRDWVVRALNADMPFDQFTVKQLAGDLLPGATLDDRIATGFHRNTQTNTEGGTDDEEFRLAAVVDRVNTTWTVWQGTTFGCVQCHSHPYDAFKHEDYYRFLAMFNSTEDADLGDDFPRLSVPVDHAKSAEAEALDREIAKLRTQINDAAKPLFASEKWAPLKPEEVTGAKEAKFSIAENEVRVDGTVGNGTTYVMKLPATTELSALRLDILPRGDDPKQWPEYGAVVGHIWMEIEDPMKVAAAKVEAEKINAEQTGLSDEEKKKRPPLPTGIDRVEFVAVYADTLTGPFDPEESLKPGVAGGGAFPKLFGPRWLVFVPKESVKVPVGAALRLHLKHTVFDAETKGSILYRFKLATTTSAAWTALALSPERMDLRKRWSEARQKRDAIPSASTLVMAERPDDAKRETRLFLRGNFLAKDKVMEPGTPGIFPPLPPGKADRLAMAKWLVSTENPLTARVLVNRVWAELFGIGIVETLEDFGSTGLPPSHPALLDFLALRFQNEQRWSLKTLLRELVLSSTYRQDHRATTELHAKDPRNRLLTRGPRTRLAAEMVRDQALATAGILTDRIGGPSVMPPQPEGVWQVVYNGAKWETPQGEDRYRRALYTYWRRTSPYPSFMTFDASSREVCTARRVVTNTPLQALVTLNDPVYFEAARALAKRMKSAGANAEASIAWALRTVTSNDPKPDQIARLAKLHADALANYKADLSLAEKAAGDPETAALTLVASTILNLDDALTK